MVWRNDPDHIELSEREAWRSTMVTSLTGSLLLLTDKPERYLGEYAEPARRAVPVLMTVPGQLYDVDPSRSSELWRADVEVSGRDPKPFDASLETSVHLYELDIERPFGSWVVLGRTGGDIERIPFEELGLDPSKEYAVFDYWEKRLLGTFSGSFAPGQVPPRYNSQVFVIRERVPHPQVLSTSRHITGGGVDLVDLAWDGARLSGRSHIVAGDPYEIYVTVPAGYAVGYATCGGVPAEAPRRDGAVAQLACRSDASRDVDWSVTFRRE